MSGGGGGGRLADNVAMGGREGDTSQHTDTTRDRRLHGRSAGPHSSHRAEDETHGNIVNMGGLEWSQNTMKGSVECSEDGASLNKSTIKYRGHYADVG